MRIDEDRDVRSFHVAGCVAAAACGRLDFDPAGGPIIALDAVVQTGSIATLAFDPTTRALTEVAPRTTLETPIDQIALDPTAAYLLAAGGVLTSYRFDDTGGLVHVSTDGGSQYSTTMRMRLAFHPTLAMVYMTGDSTGAANLL